MGGGGCILGTVLGIVGEEGTVEQKSEPSRSQLAIPGYIPPCPWQAFRKRHRSGPWVGLAALLGSGQRSGRGAGREARIKTQERHAGQGRRLT